MALIGDGQKKVSMGILEDGITERGLKLNERGDIFCIHKRDLSGLKIC